MIFSHASIREFLEVKPGTLANGSPWAMPPQYEDMPSEGKRLDLSVVMACCAVVRSFDERPRRVTQEIHDEMEDLRAAIGKMDAGRCSVVAPGLLRRLAAMGPKLCPVPLLALKALTFALADAGVLGMPLPQEEGEKEILTNRKALALLASELSLRFGVPLAAQRN